MITPHKLYANYKDRRFKPRKLYRNYSKLYVSFYWPNQANIYNKLNNKQLNKQFTIHQYTLRFMPHKTNGNPCAGEIGATRLSTIKIRCRLAS